MVIAIFAYTMLMGSMSIFFVSLFCIFLSAYLRKIVCAFVQRPHAFYIGESRRVFKLHASGSCICIAVEK